MIFDSENGIEEYVCLGVSITSAGKVRSYRKAAPAQGTGTAVPTPIILPIFSILNCIINPNRTDDKIPGNRPVFCKNVACVMPVRLIFMGHGR
jgi:hypothetical protein